MPQAHRARRVVATQPNRSDQQVSDEVGWVVFASLIILMAGMLNLLAALVAFFDHTYYLVPPGALALNIGYQAWGWAFLGYGTVLIVAGLGVKAGQTWAGVIGVILAVFNAMFHFAFMAAYPIWSMLIIALDILVIYALFVHGPEARRRAKPLR